MTSSMPFGATYAGHYDLFYAQKDYAAECDYLESLFVRFGCGAVRSILDLGCGTGNHAIDLARRGYTVCGVDRSLAMLDQARHKAAAGDAVSISFVHGDVRSLDLDTTFDAALMMFAVLGYQVTNEDLAAALATVRRHLRPGGLFIADFWYGPAVLRQGPGDRIHEHPEGIRRVLRLARAHLQSDAQVVEVRYHVLCTEESKIVEESEEEHAMRYFFPMELRFIAAAAGLQSVHLGQFLAPDRPLTNDTWNAVGVWRADC